MLPAHVREIVNDPERLSALHEFLPRNLGRDDDFDHIAEVAAAIFDAPIALVSMVDAEEQWFKSCVGYDAEGTPVDISFCAHTIANADGSTLVIPDATKDARFSKNPLVTGKPGVRFYAGAPVVAGGQKIGTLCVLDVVARKKPDVGKIQQLERLASVASSLCSAKHGDRLRSASEYRLRHVEARHTIALEVANVASWVWNVRTDEIEGDEIMNAHFGLPEGSQPTINDLLSCVDPEMLADMRQHLNATKRDGEDLHTEFKVLDGGRWLMSRGSVYEFGDDGKPTLVLGVTMDITQSKRAAENTKLLLRELNHRVKNTLAILQSMAVQTLRRSASTQEFTKAFSGRLQAISSAHEMLSDQEWTTIDFHSLAERQLGPYQAINPEAISITGANAKLGPDEALGLGLILHELATNAAKHGALSRKDGRVEIAARHSGRGKSRQFVITWKEKGGPAVAHPDSLGFGSILIERSLDKVLGSKVDVHYGKRGVRAEVRLPDRISAGK
jgi:two-component sensor histidine kinase